MKETGTSLNTYKSKKIEESYDRACRVDLSKHKGNGQNGECVRTHSSKQDNILVSENFFPFRQAQQPKTKKYPPYK